MTTSVGSQFLFHTSVNFRIGPQLWICGALWLWSYQAIYYTETLTVNHIVANMFR
jgi:hypothetical protein